MMRLRLCGQINLAIAAVTLFAVVGLQGVVFGRGFDYTPLDERTHKRLPDEARQAYDRFLEAADRINYEVAMEEINRAVEAAPQSLELRFLAVNMARYHGQMNTGVEAVKFLDMALEHAKAILNIPNIPKRQITRAQYDIERLEKARNTVDERDEARRTYGLQIARQYAKEVYPSSDKSAEVKAFQDAVKQLTAGGKSPAALAAARALSGAEGAKGEEPKTETEGEKAPEAAPEAPAPAPAEEKPAEAPAEEPKSGEDTNPFK